MKFKIREWIPEGYLVASVLVYWVMTTLLNPFAIALLIALVIIFLAKNNILAWVFSLIFLLVNLYMILAMLDEFSEFKDLNSRAIQLLVGGTLYLGTNITVATWIMIKSGKKIATSA